MAVKVITPSKTYNANYLGVQFVNGEGIFEDEALAKEVAGILGYKVEPIEDEAKEPVKTQAKAKATTRKAPTKKQEG